MMEGKKMEVKGRGREGRRDGGREGGRAGGMGREGGRREGDKDIFKKNKNDASL